MIVTGEHCQDWRTEEENVFFSAFKTISVSQQLQWSQGQHGWSASDRGWWEMQLKYLVFTRYLSCL